uniref:Uncharacterized protein n=1 Tax=Ananas comosus var. bracteatus TaxID=296719 RepID=A0A6V7QLU2_ANACO|nr:unnamed protein product [Ananas comosus var. bracteatus]
MAHIVLFPFLAQGHLNPFVSLADLLLRRRPALTVTLVSTPRNIAALRASLPPDSPLRLHSLPFSPPPTASPASRGGGGGGAVMSGKEMRRRAAEIRAVMEAAWREGIGPPGSSAKRLEEFFQVAGVR